MRILCPCVHILFIFCRNQWGWMAAAYGDVERWVGVWSWRCAVKSGIWFGWKLKESMTALLLLFHTSLLIIPFPFWHSGCYKNAASWHALRKHDAALKRISATWLLYISACFAGDSHQCDILTTQAMSKIERAWLGLEEKKEGGCCLIRRKKRCFGAF